MYIEEAMVSLDNARFLTWLGKVHRVGFITTSKLILVNVYIWLIFVILVIGDVFVVIVPLGNEEKVAYYLMWSTQIKSCLMQPYQDGPFTYQIGDLVVMGHFFEKVKNGWVYYLQRFYALVYILPIHTFGGGSSDTSHKNKG